MASRNSVDGVISVISGVAEAPAPPRIHGAVAGARHSGGSGSPEPSGAPAPLPHSLLLRELLQSHRAIRGALRVNHPEGDFREGNPLEVSSLGAISVAEGGEMVKG